MERIKLAIDKERQQRTGATRQPVVSRPFNKGTSSATSTQIYQELDSVTYSDTRVVKLNSVHLEKNRIVAYNKNDVMSINFDLLRTLVLQRMEEKGWRTLAITSPTPGSGKTVVAINLAMSIAQQTNKTAMLVDFDLRRPKIGTYLGLPAGKSLNDILEGSAELPDVLVNPDMPRLVVLATNKPVKNSSEVLSSPKISGLINELRDRYESRIVIFDLPPLLVTDDAIALLPQIDCVLMVVANGMSTKRDIEDSVRLVPAENLIGTVLNKAEVSLSDYYY